MNQAAAADVVDDECIKVIPLPPGYYQPNVGLPNLPPTYSPPLNPHQPCGTNNNNTLPSATGRPPSQIQLNQILLASGVKAPPSPNRRRRRRRIVVALVIIFLISFVPSFWLGFRTAFH